jgi:hypothetical protein
MRRRRMNQRCIERFLQEGDVPLGLAERSSCCVELCTMLNLCDVELWVAVVTAGLYRAMLTIWPNVELAWIFELMLILHEYLNWCWSCINICCRGYQPHSHCPHNTSSWVLEIGPHGSCHVYLIPTRFTHFLLVQGLRTPTIQRGGKPVQVQLQSTINLFRGKQLKSLI